MSFSRLGFPRRPNSRVGTIAWFVIEPCGGHGNVPTTHVTLSVYAITNGSQAAENRKRSPASRSSVLCSCPYLSDVFVRPIYDDASWVPTLIDYGVLVDARLWTERCQNRD